MTYRVDALVFRNSFGNDEGKNPKEVERHILEGQFPNQKMSRAIRAKCLDCCCGQESEVRRCTATRCALWPFRMGVNPFSNRKGNASALRKVAPHD